MNTGVWSSNTSGVKGVHYDKSKSDYMAYAARDGKMVWLGRYKTLEEAAAARKKWEDGYWGEMEAAGYGSKAA
jgi:hypothetical protein